MIKSYPLYDQLASKISNKDDKGIDVKRVCTTINNIFQTMTKEQAAEHYYEIAGLILHHEMLNSGMILSHAAYEGKVMVGGVGILYTTNLPINLLHIIAQYIDDHASR